MSITNRTVFYDNTGGIVRFWDWAVVTTSLGTMAEPFISSRYDFSPTIQYDATDEIAKITEIRAQDLDRSLYILSGNDEQPLHGGEQMPRDGR